MCHEQKSPHEILLDKCQKNSRSFVSLAYALKVIDREHFQPPPAAPLPGLNRGKNVIIYSIYRAACQLSGRHQKYSLEILQASATKVMCRYHISATTGRLTSHFTSSVCTASSPSFETVISVDST